MRRWFKTLFLVAIPLALSPAAQAQFPYSAAADFSTVNNDTGAWSYRWQNSLTRDGSYPLLPNLGGSAGNWNRAVTIWDVGGGGLPWVGVNHSGAAATWIGNASPFSWPADSVLMHPIPGGLAVVSWLSPVTGTVNLNWRFSDLDANGGDGIEWIVDLGDFSGGLASGVIPNGGDSGLQTINGLNVSAGDRIHFLVNPGSSGNHTFGFGRCSRRPSRRAGSHTTNPHFIGRNAPRRVPHNQSAFSSVGTRCAASGSPQQRHALASVGTRCAASGSPQQRHALASVGTRCAASGSPQQQHALASVGTRCAASGSPQQQHALASVGTLRRVWQSATTTRLGIGRDALRRVWQSATTARLDIGRDALRRVWQHACQQKNVQCFETADAAQRVPTGRKTCSVLKQ